MTNSNLPSISFVMISFNDGKILEDCLASIRSQDYPQELIKIIMVDGGSIDNTLDIAKRFNVDIKSHPELRNSPNVRAGIALTSAQSDIVPFFSADNRLQENDILLLTAQCLSDPEIVACETQRYGFKQNDPILSRYFALIGGADPIAVGLGKADRGPFDSLNWHGHGQSIDCGTYFKVSFSNKIEAIPTLGANGFFIKRTFLEKTKLASDALHIDMCVELIRQGHNKFAFLKDRHVIHFLDLNVLTFLKRRLLYANMYHNDTTERIYSVFHKNDLGNLIILVFCNLTFVIPFLRALKGYFSKQDVAWFLHPLISFIFTVGYSIFFIKRFLNKIRLRLQIT